MHHGDPRIATFSWGTFFVGEDGDQARADMAPYIERLEQLGDLMAVMLTGDPDSDTLAALWHTTRLDRHARTSDPFRDTELERNVDDLPDR